MKILFNIINYIFILLVITLIYWFLNNNFNNQQINNVNDFDALLGLKV
jgi:hypothetical protein